MRGLLLLALSTLLAACCVSQTAPADEKAAKALPVPPLAESEAASGDTVVPAVAAEPAVVKVEKEGRVVCRKDGDIRIVDIQLLADGSCVLFYDNRLSGSGTENALSSRAACEIQQQRMRENFVRSGFACD